MQSDRLLLEQLSVDAFSAKIASPDPFPGGGGASAAVAAVGIALGNMVARLTVGKKTYASVEDEMQELLVKTEELRKKFLRLISKDAEDFEPLSRAYRIPKDEPGRDEELERCLRLAAKTPMEIFDLSCEALELFEPLAHKGSKLAVSDAATGVVFCWAAVKGAAINVKVNTALMKDREYAEKLNAHLDEAMTKYKPLADSVYDFVYSK